MTSRSYPRISLAKPEAIQGSWFARDQPPDGPREERWPRVLIVTSSLGSGHASAAKAVKLALHERMPEACVRTLDYWSLMDAQVAQTIRQTYLSLVQDHPQIYDRLYEIDQRVWRDALMSARPSTSALSAMFEYLKTHIPQDDTPLAGGERHPADRFLLRLFRATLPGSDPIAPAGQAMLRIALAKWGWTSLARRLQVKLRAFRPDVIIATQMIPAALLAAARARHDMGVPVIGVITDFGVHDFWVQSGIDLYCVAHRSVENLDSLPPDRISVTGIPLRPGFRALPSREEARRALGLRLDQPVVLVPGGGLGIGVDGVAARLLHALNGTQIIALTGQDAAAHDALTRLSARYRSRLRVWSWTDRIELQLRAADLVVGKPGGLTVAEALACGRPLYPTHSLRGQEGFNVRFLQNHGVGRLLGEDSFVPVVDALLHDPPRLASLQRAAWTLGRRDGAMLIAGKALALARNAAARAASLETA
jgi:processive 1,2-diacylglycerol beta-glucosyltransferase